MWNARAARLDTISIPFVYRHLDQAEAHVVVCRGKVNQL